MATHAANAKLLQRLNERNVLEQIRAQHPISRAEIARRLDLSKPTVSTVLLTLLEAGLVREASEVIHPNYGATFYEPVFEAAHVLGFDIGARFLRGAMCDLGGTIRAREDVLVAGKDAKQILRQARDLRDRLLAAAGAQASEIDGAVVGVPGVIDDSGRVALGSNIPGLEGTTLAEIREQLDLEVGLENDINLAATGEQWRGVGQGFESFVFLSVGTGIGAGIILDGALRRGRHGAAGEMEFAASERLDEDPCALGIKFHTETLLAGGEYPRTVLRPPYDPPAVFEAARAADELARVVVEGEARRIAHYVETIAAVVDVELVVLGGGIGVNGDLLLAPLREALRARLPYPPQLEVSSLGDTAVVMGALALGLQAALENVVTRRRPVPAA